MNWRRVAEAMRLRKAVQLMDDRDTHAEQIEDHARRIEDLAERTQEEAEAIQDMTTQARLGSYRRVRIR